MNEILNAIGYGLWVAIICAGLCGFIHIFHRMEGSLILGICLGTGVGNAFLYYFGFIG